MPTSVVSTFEGGFQPLTAINATTILRQAGHSAELIDTYVEGLDISRLASSEIVVIGMPLFDSLRSGVDLAQRIRIANPQTTLVFFGQYATINARQLSQSYADFVVTGEPEKSLAALFSHLADPVGKPLPDGVITKNVIDNDLISSKSGKGFISLPQRDIAPSLNKYPQPQVERLLGTTAVVGGVEVTRGCHHRCTYCSVFAVYNGKVIVVGDDVVLADVHNLVEMGMTHLTFTDAEFFNSKRTSIRILEELHTRYPKLTYDFTTRVDHIVDNESILKNLADLGVQFITSALEFPKQSVLDQVAKEVSMEMIERSIALLKDSGITLNPTFIMFNPWVGLDDIIRFEDFIHRNDLSDVIDPIQFETRLHLYKGSPLLSNPTIQALSLEEQEFHFDWSHPDPRVDELYRTSVTPPEEGVFKRCCLKC